MSVIFLFSGKQFEYIPGRREVFRVDFQKRTKAGDTLLLDKVLSWDDNFGQPFLNNVALQAEIIRHGLKKKITVFKYKAKKRYKVKKGYRAKYTEIRLLGKSDYLMKEDETLKQGEKNVTNKGV